MSEEPKDLNSAMHSQSRREISEIKKKAEERLQEFLLLAADVKQVGTKLDHLDKRLNEGVSKTAFKTYEKVNEITGLLSDMKHENEKRDLKIEGLEEDIGANEQSVKMTINWVMGISASALMAVVGLAIWIIQSGRAG